MNPKVNDIQKFLHWVAPEHLAESWDNTGLLLGDSGADVKKVMTCLTLTEDVAVEAIGNNADLVITHHPLPFKPLKKISTESQPGKILWNLARSGISVLCPHTCFDGGPKGINWQILEALGLQEIRPIHDVPAGELESSDEASVGKGRIGQAANPLEIKEIYDRLQDLVGPGPVKFVESGKRKFQRIAVGCGSAGELLVDVAKQGGKLLILGETNFHTCLQAKQLGVSLLLIGHYRSERFALEVLADELGEQFPNIECWASQVESDPVEFL